MIPTLTTEQKQALLQFFGGYFHEDWDLDHGTAEQALSAAIGAHEDQRAGLAELIMVFIEAHPDDEELERALWKDLGCCYLPTADGISVRTWLSDVAGKLVRPGNSK